VTHLGFHAFEKLCQNALPPNFPYELKSTRPQDRKILEACMREKDCPFKLLVRKIHAKSDTDYIDVLIRFVEDFLMDSPIPISAMDISADFIRLDADMRKLQKSLSKKFSNQF
jgi:hypothetical protein